MKKIYPIIALLFIMGTMVNAQEKAVVTIKVTKDGEVVKDTTYSYADINQAKAAIKMMDLVSSEELHILDGDEHGFSWVTSETIEEVDGKKVIKIATEGSGTKAWAFMSDDDENVVVNEKDGTWTIKEDDDVEVIILKKQLGDDEKEVKVEVIVKDEKEEMEMKEKQEKKEKKERKKSKNQ